MDAAADDAQGRRPAGSWRNACTVRIRWRARPIVARWRGSASRLT